MCMPTYPTLASLKPSGMATYLPFSLHSRVLPLALRNSNEYKKKKRIKKEGKKQQEIPLMGVTGRGHR